MSAIDINRWINSLLLQLQTSLQRQLVTLQGPQAWCDAQFEQLLQLEPTTPVLSNRALTAGAIPFDKADACLGSEARLVILDLFDGFNPDVLCIASGLVQSAGILVLLSPPQGDWDLRRDRYARWQGAEISRQPHFVEYFFDALRREQNIGVLVTPETDLLSAAPLPELPALQPTPIEQGQTAEQSYCLQQIEHWLGSGEPGIALIHADRGRGKSTCLGLTVAGLQSSYRIVVSANSRQTALPLLQLAPDAEFMAPDRLLQTCPPADLVILDEAAMIPQSMLRQMTRLYPRLLMATTSGGYEGTGQGFMLRFVAALASHRLIRLRLEHPVRWCQGDLLEAWLDSCLMWASASTGAPRQDADLASCELQLLTNPGDPRWLPLLKQVYLLLNSAHYRTRPSDLRMLMENPDLVLVVACCEGLVVAAALLNREGGLDDDLCREVFLGRRRPRGHLLAQMLTAQAGISDFARYRGLRVQRIAVAEGYRRKGLGSRLLERALCYARDHSMDYIGACFALDPDTACFWQQARFELVHVSYGQGKSSGEQSIAVLQPLSSELIASKELLQQRLAQQLPTWMTQFLQTMDARQVAALLRFARFDASINALEQQEIEAFARGNKGFELCFVSLQKYVMCSVARTAVDCDALLIEKAIQNRDWRLLERESGAEGRKQLQRRLRVQVDALLKAC
jgi:tRNA(Met) cytidine acetyltransferase